MIWVQLFIYCLKVSANELPLLKINRTALVYAETRRTENGPMLSSGREKTPRSGWLLSLRHGRRFVRSDITGQTSNPLRRRLCQRPKLSMQPPTLLLLSGRGIILGFELILLAAVLGDDV